MPKSHKSFSPLTDGFNENLTQEIALAITKIVAKKKSLSNIVNDLVTSTGHVASLPPRVTSLNKADRKGKSATAKSKANGAEGKTKTKKKKKVKGQSSSNDLVKKDSSSKKLVKKSSSSKTVSKKNSSSSKVLVTGQSSEVRKLEAKLYAQGLNLDDLPYENVSEPIEVSHESLVCRSDKPIPPLIKDVNVMDTSLYLARVQSYFDQLGYHRVGEPTIHVNTRLSIKHLIGTCRELIKAGQPIKCLHALILAVHFTNPCTIIERFPLHFKSKAQGKEFKHVVLGVYVQGYFGALGISRDPGLQDKPPTFARLSELITEFYKCYTDSGHELLEVKIGTIITHDPHSLQTITWKLGVINFRSAKLVELEIEIERSSKKLRSLMGLACLRCMRPSPVGGNVFDSMYPSYRPPFGSSTTSRSKAYASMRQDKINTLFTPRSKTLPANTKAKKM